MSVVYSSAALHFFPFLPKIFSVRLGRRSPSTASRIGPPTPLPDPCFCTAGGAENIQTLSSDPYYPTPFFTGTGVNYLQPGGRCVEGGIDYRPHGSQFVISASPAAAPQSCGSFFWDPLLSSIEGDGFAWDIVNGQRVAVDMRVPTETVSYDVPPAPPPSFSRTSCSSSPLCGSTAPADAKQRVMSGSTARASWVDRVVTFGDSATYWAPLHTGSGQRSYQREEGERCGEHKCGDATLGVAWRARHRRTTVRPALRDSVGKRGLARVSAH